MVESELTEELAVSDAARELHSRSIVALTHVHEIWPSHFRRMRRGGITAAFVVTSVDGRMYAPQELWLESLETDAGLLGSTLSTLDYIQWLAAKESERVTVALEIGDLDRAKQEDKIALVLGSEGSRFLEGKLEVLRAVYRLGVRYIAPMWFYDCAVGSAQDATDDRGLTDWGQNLIAEVNRLGIVLDANHFSKRSLAEALEISTKPLLVSHTGALVLNPEARQLLSDDLLKKVAAAGGVIGLMFQSFIIKPGYEQAEIEDLVRQFTYCAELIGPEHIACGSDYLYNDPRLWGGNNPTGASPGPLSYPKGLEHPGKLPHLTEALLTAGFNELDVESMLGKNVARLFDDTRQGAPAVPTGDYDDVGDENRAGTRTGGLTPA